MKIAIWILCVPFVPAGIIINMVVPIANCYLIVVTQYIADIWTYITIILMWSNVQNPKQNVIRQIF